MEVASQNVDPAIGVWHHIRLVTYITLCQELGAELHVIVQVKRATTLKVVAEGGYGGRLGGEILHTSHATELSVGVLRDG